MRVLYCHRTRDGDADGNSCLAAVDFQITDHVRLYGLRLMRMRDGRHMIFAPQSGRRRVATFTTAMAKRLTEMALAAYKEAGRVGN